MANWKGGARAIVTDPVNGQYGIGVTTNTSLLTPLSITGDQATWELNAGASITLKIVVESPGSAGTQAYYFWVYYETGTGTIVRQFLSGQSTTGGSHTFYATHDGTATGTPIPGTLRLRIRWERSGTAGGLGNFQIDSDGGSTVPALWTVNSEDKGVLRANINAATLNHSGYPSGSQYAFGASADEIMSVTAGYPVPPAIRGHEKVRVDILDGATVKVAGSVVTVSGGGTTQLSATVNESTFNAALQGYGVRFTVSGAAQLQPTSEGSMTWARVIAATGQTQNGNAVEKANLFQADPRLTAGAPTITPATGLANIGDATNTVLGVTNSRGQSLTRALTLTLRDSLGATKATGSATGPNYARAYTLVGGDDATADASGKQYTLRISHAQQVNTPTVNTFKASQFRALHSSATLPGGDIANADGALASAVTTTSDDGGGGDRSFLNLEESCRIQGYMFRADGNPWTRAVTMQAIAENGTVEDSQSVTPNGSGLLDWTYKLVAGDEVAQHGSWKHARATNGDGNIQLDSPDSWRVSNLLYIGDAVGVNNWTVQVTVGDANGSDGTLGGLFPRAAFNVDSGESSPFVQFYLSYRRGTKFANKTFSLEVLDDAIIVEHTITPSTDANGKVAVALPIGQSDKRSAFAGKSLPSLSNKEIRAAYFGNGAGRSAVHGLTEHVWLDSHDQREQTLVKDDWNSAAPTDGSENATEEPVNYVKLDHTIRLWAHAKGIRLDREIQTSGNAITQSILNPNGSTHDSLATDTGADGWTTRWDTLSDDLGASSSLYKHKAVLNFEGNRNEVEDLFELASPLITGVVRVWAPVKADPGSTVTVWAQTLDEGANGLEETPPDTPPTLRVGKLTADPESVDDFVSDVEMYSAATDTKVVDGSLYYLSFTVPTGGFDAGVLVQAAIAGSKIERTTVVSPYVPDGPGYFKAPTR